MAGSSGAIRAGEAYVELGTKDGPLQKGLKAAEKQIAAWGSAVQQIGLSLFASGMARLAIGAGALKVFASVGTELRDLSIQTGITVEGLQTLAATARRNGSSMEELVHGVGKMERFLVQAAEGGAAANQELSRMGLTISELANLNPDQQFTRIAEAISAIENPAERTARAMAIFGRGGATLIPTLQALAGGNRASPSRIITKEEAEAAHQFSNSINALYGDLKKVAFIIGLALLPAAKQLVSWLKEGIEAVVRFVDANQALIVTLATGAAADVACGIALYGLGIAVNVVSAAFGVLNTIVGVTTAVLGFLLSPVFLVVAGVTLLVAGLAYLIYTNEHVQQSIRDMLPAFAEFGATFSTTWGGIMDAISTGDLAGAFEVAWLGVQVVWVQATNWMMNRLRLIKLGFLNTWDEIATSIAIYMNTAVTNVVLAFNNLLGMLPAPVQQALAQNGIARVQNNGAANEVAIRQALAERNAARAQQALAGDAAGAARLQEAQDALDEALGRLGENAQAAAEARARAITDATAGAGMTLAMSSQGTFSANQAAAFGASSTPAERTAQSAEEIARLTAQVLAAIRGSVLVFQA